MKNLVLFSGGWRSLCLLVLIAFLFSCRSMVTDLPSGSIGLAVLMEKGNRLLVGENGDVSIIEDASCEDRCTASFVFTGDKFSQVYALRDRLISQGALRVELFKID